MESENAKCCSEFADLLVASKLVKGYFDDPVIIVAAVRTPITRAIKGGKDIKLQFSADRLLAAVLSSVISNASIDKNDISDVAVGNVLLSGSAVMARLAMCEATIPDTVAVSSVNRQCASGLEAIAMISGHILSGSYDIGVAAGVESMSVSEFKDSIPNLDWEYIKSIPSALKCIIPMGVTSDILANRFHISRENQDIFAMTSHQKAMAAQQSGAFESEIVSFNNNMQDNGIRSECTLDGLDKLKPAFATTASNNSSNSNNNTKNSGSTINNSGSSNNDSNNSSRCTTTAGNSSQISDGAAAVLLCRQSVAAARGLSCLAVIRTMAVVGVPPDIMGVGPAFAIPEVLRRAGMSLQDIDVFEINEAFASQCVFCIKFLGIPPEKVNPLGGAIALGHPLGCTGVRLVVTMTHYLRRTGKRFGVVSMCVGTGMGMAVIIENPKGRSPYKSKL